jgi:hypothetical protein
MLIEEPTNEWAVPIDGGRHQAALPLQVRLVPKTQLIGFRALGDDRRCDDMLPTQKLEECANASARSVTTLAPSLLEVRLDELLVEVSDAAPPRLQPNTEILQDSQPNLPDEPTISSFDQLGRECVEVRAEWTGAQDASFPLAYEVLDHVSSLADDRRPSGGGRIMPNRVAPKRG